MLKRIKWRFGSNKPTTCTNYVLINKVIIAKGLWSGQWWHVHNSTKLTTLYLGLFLITFLKSTLSIKEYYKNVTITEETLLV